MPKKSLMDNVSRPLIALLVGSVAFFALWILALKPSPSSSGGSPGVGQYQSAINKAHQVVAASNAASGAHGTSTVTHPATSAKSTAVPVAKSTSTTSHTATSSSAVSSANRAARQSLAAKHRLEVVTGALVHKRVLALLFYNPASADDRAVKQELAAVPTHGHRVVKLAVPLTELARYTVVTTQVPVTGSPTLVLIDRAGQAATLVGFADRFEIAQRVADALAIK